MATDRLKFKGEFRAVCRNPDGTVAWEEVFTNGTTNAGLNSILGVYFHGDTQLTTWYMGLIDNDGFTALSANDTMSSHAGWAENEDYDETDRPTWTEGAASGGVITNGTAVAFSINASVTIKGAFIVSDDEKGGTAGVLWATGAFSSNQTLSNGQTLQLTYTCTATGS